MQEKILTLYNHPNHFLLAVPGVEQLKGECAFSDNNNYHKD